MSEFTFNLSGLNISQEDGLAQTPANNAVPAGKAANGAETFKVKGPPGMTLEQARAVFEQQVKTGGVVGFAPGDSLSATTQAFDGLEAAKAQFGQATAGLSGNLPIGTNLQTLAASIGPGGTAAAGQISSFATGAAAALNTMRVNATGFVSDPQTIGALGSSVNQLPQVPSQINTALTRDGASLLNDVKSFAGEISGVVGKTVSTISNLLKGTPTDGIDSADLSKTVSALGPLPGLGQNQVTATLAQAQKLAGQKFDQMTNANGVGAFGFDAAQLEKAGLVKPGTAAEFLAQGKNDLLSVLKSPSVWTGKEGVTKVQDFLGNPALQSKIQQGLMKDGLSDLKQLGVPTDKMTPQALSGLATNAAKNVQDTFKWAQNSPDLPTSVKEQYDKAAVNTAYATNLAETKVEEPVLKEKVVEPSENTVNSDTVDAAANRVVGNDKVPDVTSNSGSNEAATKTGIFIALVGSTYASALSIDSTISKLESDTTISQESWNAVNQEFIAVKATYNARIDDVQSAAVAAIDELGAPRNATLVQKFNSAQSLITKSLFPLFTNIKQRLAALANKIAT